MLRKIWGIVWPLAVGTAGGAVFYLLHLPLPWTLGALTAVALVAIFGPPFKIPALTNIARPVVGVLAGSAFTPASSAVRNVSRHRTRLGRRAALPRATHR